MFSQSAYRYGDYVVKYALFPVAKEQLEIKSQKVKDTDSSNILSEWIQTYFRNHPARYKFRIQFCIDLSLQPVEDTNVEWSQLLAPFHTVATLEIPRQEALDPGLCRWWHDDIRLYPWAGLEEHRPLGSINRVRKRVYDASAAHRAKKNEQKVVFPQNTNNILPQTPL